MERDVYHYQRERTALEQVVGMIGLIGSFALTAPSEKVFFGLPLVVLIIAAGIVIRLSSNPAMVLANWSRGRVNG